MRFTTLAFTALALVVLSGCSREFTAPLPEIQNDPGYAGDWSAIVAGQQMAFRVDPFLEGAGSTTARLVYGGFVDWPMVCSLVPVGEGDLALDCNLTIDEEPPVCSIPSGTEPAIEITESAPRLRLVVEIGGNLRQGTTEDCTGDVIVDWGAGDSYTFTPN